MADEKYLTCDMLDLINLCLKHNVEISIRPMSAYPQVAMITTHTSDNFIKDANAFDTTLFGMTRFDLNSMIFDSMRRSVRRVEVERDRKLSMLLENTPDEEE